MRSLRVFSLAVLLASVSLAQIYSIPGGGSGGGAGTPGVNGHSVLNGVGAPSTGTGASGDFYIDTAATAIYGPKSGGTWGSPTALIGPTGPTGPTGATGPQGPAGTGGGGSNGAGTLAGMPTTCTDGQIYLATDQQAGKTVYTCSSAHVFTAPWSVGATGALTFASNTLDINTSYVPSKTGTNSFSGSNTFNNLTVTGTCTGCGGGGSGFLLFSAGQTVTSAACSSNIDNTSFGLITIPANTAVVGSEIDVSILAVVVGSGNLNASSGNQYLYTTVGNAVFPQQNGGHYGNQNLGAYFTENIRYFVTDATHQTGWAIYEGLTGPGDTNGLRYAAPFNNSSGSTGDVGFGTNAISSAIPVNLFLEGCGAPGAGGQVQVSWSVRVIK